MLAYVINQDGKPLMPCRPIIARLLLKEGKAKGTGWIKGKRSTGFFAISDLEGKTINPSVNVKKDYTRLKARTTTLTERRGTFLPGASSGVSCA